MRSERLALGGLIAVGLVAGLGGRRLLKTGRRTARRATGTTFRSGVPSYGKPATADPAHGRPA